MSTVLITKFKSKAAARRAEKMLRAEGISFESYIDEIEDVYLSKLIDEGMREEGEIPFEQVKRELNERLNDLKEK